MATVNDVGQDIEKYVESEVKENANSVDFPEDVVVESNVVEESDGQVTMPEFMQEG